MHNINVLSLFILYDVFPLIYIIKLNFKLAVSRALRGTQAVEMTDEIQDGPVVGVDQERLEEGVAHEFQILFYQELFVQNGVLKEG